MTITVPPAVNYPSPLVAVPTKYANAPPEGPKLIDCEIDWGSMGGTSDCVNFNLQNNATLNFSQITTISVDNSACGGDIQFVFPDTGETTSIPAYTPKAIVPVFSNQTQFFVVGYGVQSEDISRFTIHNTLPPPVVVPTTQEQNTVGSVQSAAASGTYGIVSNTVNGTLENANIFYTGPGAPSGVTNFMWTLEDGASKVIAAGEVSSGFSSTGVYPTNAMVLDLQDAHVRFQQGINLIIAGGGSYGGAFSVNLYYRTP